MNLNIISIRKSINKAFLKVKPNRTQIEKFKENILNLYDQINETESEEFHKNIISAFLKDTYYSPDHYLNTKGRTDLVIHNGKDSNSSVGVLIETKKPSNKSEMPSKNNLNSKAVQELILYFLRERITNKNLEVKHLIVTNIYEWFVFNASDFDRLFAQDKKLVKQFTDFEEGRLSESKTDFFYKQIAEPFLNELKSEISFTWFDIRGYEKTIRKNDKLDDKKLVALFKLFSSENLLKLPFVNDSNSLDKRFYSELLHIIGLQETKDGSKKLIGRKTEKDRNAGSLIENTITILKYEDCLSQIKASDYGANQEEQLFNVALELVITWINRVLFLKLLEGQLVKYHAGDKSYKFLSFERIPDFDALNKLFFQVLAIKENERSELVKKKFGSIPYLNSSLFEPNELEHKTVRVSNLEDEYSLPILNSTVLKDKTGKRLNGELNSLQYLFDFLDAYDFASEGAEDIQEENKTIINASVLGLIFEKINGYKDGSFFTPGFITMYMCRETIRRAVVQKFNETKSWNCKDIDGLYDKIEDRKEANEIINSLKICDPAVGSGHFLVSALNEIIAIKNDLKILSDIEGKRLKEYQVEVVNDELVITDDDGELFEYSPKNKESQRIQETLFHEKQTIIENCLFGVDINPNSVKICRLRLWIELLKNAYYKSGTEELETLPNIDINIKCGNSLISRYTLDADIKKALQKSKWSIDSYRLAAMSYRNAKSKDEKRSMEKLINEIKNDFESEIAANDKRVLKLNKLKGELFAHTNQQSLFDQTKTEKTNWNNKVKKYTTDIQKLETQLEEIKTNKIYENAFEWRFEFPEILNDEGDFVGFDVVIGNPPYIRQEEFTTFKPYLSNNFKTFNGTADLFVYFIELGIERLKANGEFIFIVPNKWMKAGYGRNVREYVMNLNINSIIDFGDLPVFEEASTYPCILSIKKSNEEESFRAVYIKSLEFQTSLNDYITQNSFKVNAKSLSESGWTLRNEIEQKVFNKIKNSGIPLGKYVDGNLYRGILTGFNNAFIINEELKTELISQDSKNAEIIKPFLAGKDIKKYNKPISTQYLIFTRRGIDIESYPSIKSHLLQFKDSLEPKPKDYSGNKWKGRKPGNYKWYEIQDAVDYYEKFEFNKIVWPETSLDNQFCYVEAGVYLNKTAFFIPITSNFLLALLNSSLAKFYFDSIVSKMRGGYFSMSKAYVETIGVIENEVIVNDISDVVEKLLSKKPNEVNSDTTELESQIDKLIYKLYDLTEEEIKIVEGEK